VVRLHQARAAAKESHSSMSMDMRFPGGVAVEAAFDGFKVRTDQPRTAGGGGSAPSPFDLFLASIGTCAGFYALRFCQQRGLPTGGLALRLTTERDSEKKCLSRIRIEIDLPPDFPEKYREAILRAVDQCTVKRHIVTPPVVEVAAIPAEEPVSRSA
jgi:putative redox protein